MDFKLIGLIILAAPGGVVAFIIMGFLQLLGVKHQAEGGIGGLRHADFPVFFDFLDHRHWIRCGLVGKMIVVTPLSFNR